MTLKARTDYNRYGNMSVQEAQRILKLENVALAAEKQDYIWGVAGHADRADEDMEFAVDIDIDLL